MRVAESQSTFLLPGTDGSPSMDPHLRRILWEPWDRVMGCPECTQIPQERRRWQREEKMGEVKQMFRRRNRCLQKIHATLNAKKKRSPGWPGVLGA